MEINVHKTAKYCIWLSSCNQQLRTQVASHLTFNKNLGNTKQQGANTVSQTQVWGRMLEFSLIILAVLL